jgi:hypothetical protein
MGTGLTADDITGASRGAMSCQRGRKLLSVVERIAAFAVAAPPDRLAPETRRPLIRDILDSLGCAIAALSGPPFQALREQIDEYRAPGSLHVDRWRQDLGGSGGVLPAKLSRMRSSGTRSFRRCCVLMPLRSRI